MIVYYKAHNSTSAICNAIIFILYHKSFSKVMFMKTKILNDYITFNSVNTPNLLI